MDTIKALILFLILLCGCIPAAQFIITNTPIYLVNAVLYIAIFLVCIKKNGLFNYSFNKFLFFAFILLLNLINNIFIQSGTFALICMIWGIFAVSRFYLSGKDINRLFWLACIFVLLLPVKDYLQIFIGVPIRLLSANAIASIFSLIHVKTVTSNAVLIFENSFSNIDYVCSGTLTIFYFSFLASLMSFILNAKFDIKWLYKYLFCIFILILLNTARIFTIMLFTGYLELDDAGKAIHTSFGIINFIIVCGIFMFLNKKPSHINSDCPIKTDDSMYKYLVIASLLLTMPVYFLHNNNFSQELLITKNFDYLNLPFSYEEISFYKRYSAEIERYIQNSVIITKVVSFTPLAQHNPLICIKVQGLDIKEMNTVIVKNGLVKHIKTNRGEIYYFYTDGKKIYDDYYIRVYKGLFSNKKWIMYILYSEDELDSNFIQEILKI